MKQKRKYDLLTIIIAVVTLTVLAVGALFLANFVGVFGEELTDSADDMVSDGTINGTLANYTTDFVQNDVSNYADNYVFWFFIAVFLGLIFTALYLEFEPAVMIIIFIFGIIGVLGAWIGSQIYGDFASDTEMAVTNSGMSKTAILMGSPYFPIFVFAGLIIMLVIMYSKKRSNEYQ